VQLSDFVSPEFVKVVATVFDVFNVAISANECKYVSECLELSFRQLRAIWVEFFQELTVVEAFLYITLLICQ